MAGKTNMDTSNINILFVLQHAGQPRFFKRIKMMQEQGFTAEAVAFDRSRPSECVPSCKVTTLGKIKSGKYLSRLPVLFKAIPILREHIKQADVVYCMGADMSLLAYFASIGIRRTRIVEVADIVPLQTLGGIAGKIVRFFDKLQAESCDRVVVTAPDYLNIYYRRWVRCKTPGLVLENKVEPQVAVAVDQRALESMSKPDSKRIRIGYIGELRCQWSWQVLIDLAMDNPETHEVIFAGNPSGLVDFEETIARLPNVTYQGQYTAPDDLASIYSKIDLVWACYKPPFGRDYWNHKWAMPNRFYEACLYRKPLVSRKGCHESVVVMRHKIGVCLNSFEVKDASTSLAKVTREQVDNSKANMQVLPEHVYRYSAEASGLAKNIHESWNESYLLASEG